MDVGDEIFWLRPSPSCLLSTGHQKLTQDFPLQKAIGYKGEGEVRALFQTKGQNESQLHSAKFHNAWHRVDIECSTQVKSAWHGEKGRRRGGRELGFKMLRTKVLLLNALLFNEQSIVLSDTIYLRSCLQVVQTNCISELSYLQIYFQ